MTVDAHSPLIDELRSRQVRIESPDENTLVLRHVPIHPDYFNKPRTNLLLKRSKQGQPFVVCVDEDLSYRGGDRSLMRAFASGPRRNGWRILSMNPTAWRDSESALEAGLTALGFRGGEPRYDSPQQSPQQSKSRILQQSAVNLTDEARSDRAVPTIGRDVEVERLASCVLCWGQTRLGLIVGESGTGKTNLLCGLARLLAGQRPDTALLRVDVAEILAGTFLEAERETIMLELLREALAVPNAVLALERLDCALTREGVVGNLISLALDDGLRLVGTALPGALRRFRRPPLGRRIQVVKMQEATAKHAGLILAALKDQIAAHHRVQIDDALLAVAIRLAHGLPGRLPAKAIALLDQAASSTALLKSPVVSPDDLFSAAKQLGSGETDNPERNVDEDNEGYPSSRDN